MKKSPFVLAALLVASTAFAGPGPVETVLHCLRHARDAATRAVTGQGEPLFSIARNGRGIVREPAIPFEQLPFNPKKIFDDVVARAHKMVEDSNEKRSVKDYLKNGTVYAYAQYDGQGRMISVTLNVRNGMQTGITQKFGPGSEIHDLVRPALEMAEAKRRELESSVAGLKRGQPYEVLLLLNQKNSDRLAEWHDHPEFQFVSNIQLSPVARGTQFRNKDGVESDPDDPLHWIHFGKAEDHRIPPQSEGTDPDADDYRFTMVINHE